MGSIHHQRALRSFGETSEKHYNLRRNVNWLHVMTVVHVEAKGYHYSISQKAAVGRAGLFDSTRGLLATDHVILNHGQVTWTTPELAPPLLTTTPHQREDVSAFDRFNVHRCPTRRVFSGTGIEPVTKQATVRYLYHSATAAPRERMSLQ
ncbi:uncharacterized protein TNCV_1792541 [Trichonephila clavipes]|nr:uncharacterized protein TNCV_1792541 [Trichonephila clavipes]